MISTQLSQPESQSRVRVFLKALNGQRHKRALQIFMAIVCAHWVEHLLQAFQIFVLGWPRPLAGGALGLLFPWLVTSEWLHYVYALVMLVGLILLRSAFQGRSRAWWDVALFVQFWHHFEHVLLLGQAIAHDNLFGSPVPISLLQLFVPRVELHLFYNAVVTAPMLVAIYYHAFPPSGEAQAPVCVCSHHSQSINEAHYNWRREMTIKTIVLQVVGEQTIHCAGCENTIRRGLMQLSGVRRAEPSHKTQRIELTLDTDQVALETVREKLNWMGWQTREPEGAGG